MRRRGARCARRGRHRPSAAACEQAGESGCFGTPPATDFDAKDSGMAAPGSNKLRYARSLARRETLMLVFFIICVSFSFKIFISCNDSFCHLSDMFYHLLVLSFSCYHHFCCPSFSMIFISHLTFCVVSAGCLGFCFLALWFLAFLGSSIFGSVASYPPHSCKVLNFDAVARLPISFKSLHNAMSFNEKIPESPLKWSFGRAPGRPQVAFEIIFRAFPKSLMSQG